MGQCERWREQGLTTGASEHRVAAQGASDVARAGAAHARPSAGPGDFGRGRVSHQHRGHRSLAEPSAQVSGQTKQVKEQV